MINKKQLAALKYLIMKSSDSNEFVKKVCFFLLDESHLLDRTLTMRINEDEKYSVEFLKQASYGIHDMNSSNGSTFLQEIFTAMDSPFSFGFNTGFLPNADDPNRKYYVNIWLSKKYSATKNNLENVVFDSDAIESISLESAEDVYAM